VKIRSHPWVGPLASFGSTLVFSAAAALGLPSWLWTIAVLCGAVTLLWMGLIVLRDFGPIRRFWTYFGCFLNEQLPP
jgi:hypothetical protein